MHINFNGTKQTFNATSKEIELKQTNLKEDLELLETVQPDYTTNKGYIDTDKGEYGIHLFDEKAKPSGKMIVKSNNDGDIILIVSKIDQNGNVEQTSISNNETNAALKEPENIDIPKHFKGFVLDKASSILQTLKQKVVLNEKAQTFADNVIKTAQEIARSL